MKTLEQIKDEVAKECLMDNWDHLERCASAKSSITRKMNIVANRYAQQFQSPADTIVTEISVMQERIAELEDVLKLLVDECDGNNFSSFREKIESLINKGK